MSNTTNNTPTVNPSFKKGVRVNAPFEDELYAAVILRVMRSAKLRVQFDDDAEATVKAADCELRKRGRKSIAESMSAQEIGDEVKGLLAELTGTADQEAKKRIRRALRRRGHTGGLRSVNE